MKKTLLILFIIITFFLIYFLQCNFFRYFTIAGIKPNLFVILILCISLFCGKKIGIPMGIIFGLFIDVEAGRNIGPSIIMFGIIAAIGGYLNNNFSKDSKLTIMLMVMGCTAIYEIGSYIFNIINIGVYIEIFYFIKILIIEVLYNSILTIILYPIIKFFGERMENIFFGSKIQNRILTRYF